MDTALTIEALVGLGVKYNGCTEFNTKEEFDALRWEDERPKPKWKELVVKWEEIRDIPEQKTELELKIENLEARIVELESKIVQKR